VVFAGCSAGVNASRQVAAGGGGHSFSVRWGGTLGNARPATASVPDPLLQNDSISGFRAQLARTLCQGKNRGKVDVV
jgi:hypothetical protein